MGGDIIPVILAGGAGTRLEPLSQPDRPKQFWPLLGDRSPFQDALRRVSDIALYRPPVIVTNDMVMARVAEQARGTTIGRVLAEPIRRNTGPAILAAALLCEREHGPDCLIHVLPSDHAVEADDAYFRSVLLASDAARNGRLIAFGVRATRAEEDYGYIEAASLSADVASPVVRFVEKPSRDAAEAMLATGRFCWNSGMFMLRVRDLLTEAEALIPDCLEVIREAVATAKSEGGTVHLGESFSTAPAISIDKAIFERTSRCAVVPLTCAWSDLGTWDAVWTMREIAPCERPWGRYSTIFESEAIKVKRLSVAPGKRLSLQWHEHRSELWIVRRGRAEVRRGEATTSVASGQTIEIGAQQIHRLCNPGTDVLEVIEIQRGSYLGEDDITRLADDYGRA
jgi:mannose-1-phosphate guanylyltransferase